MIGYGHVGCYDIKEYFDHLKETYRCLKLVPCLWRITIEAEGVEERGGSSYSDRGVGNGLGCSVC